VPLHEFKTFTSKDALSDNVITWLFEEDSFSPIAKIKNDKQYRIVNDHLGTPYESYDDKGDLVWSRELNSNGKVLKETGIQNFCPFLYQGQSFDNEIELAYNRFRYYDPEDSKYISQDPIGLLSGEFGFYNYVDDTNYLIDIFGQQSTYAKKYFDASKRMKKFIGKKKIEIHHRIPQKYIGSKKLFPESMRTSLSNLQGLPRDVHRKVVSPEWAKFRKLNPNPTRAQVMKQAMKIDKMIAQHLNKIN